MPPLPTNARLVSGKARTNVTKHNPDAMARNQNIHLQPGPEANAPPTDGPTLGAVVILQSVRKVRQILWVFSIQDNHITYPNDMADTKAPLSLGAEISAMTP